MGKDRMIKVKPHQKIGVQNNSFENKKATLEQLFNTNANR